jgi:hypothetical protein
MVSRRASKKILNPVEALGLFHELSEELPGSLLDTYLEMMIEESLTNSYANRKRLVKRRKR